MSKQIRAAIAFFVLCMLQAVSIPAFATSVTPLQVELTSVGKGSRSQVTITNTGATPLPLETNLQVMELDENGERKLSNGGEDLLVFPPQAVVPAGGTQVFRVQWAGEPMLDKSKSYLLSITQVPVKLAPTQSSVQVVVSFGVVVNVAPPQGSPALKLIATGVVTDKQGKRHPTITVENETPVHALLQNATIQLSGGNWSQTLTPAMINTQIGIGLVQPGKRRRVTLPFDLPADVKTIQASVELTTKRP
jgi:fimbrial chaperone protein